MKTIKIDDKRVGLNLNSKHKTREQKQEHKGSNQENKVCTTKVQTKNLLQ
jgi:hypothetical protein